MTDTTTEMDDIEARQRAAGVVVEEPAVPSGTQNYWGNVTASRFYMPDGVQYIEYKPMTEGKRSKYQTATSTSMSINRNSGESKMAFNVARDRRALIDASVTDWYMLGPDGKEAKFSSPITGFWKWYEQADPKLIERLEAEIRKANPWLQADMDADEIKEEIARLEDLLVEVQERELGEGGSSNK